MRINLRIQLIKVSMSIRNPRLILDNPQIIEKQVMIYVVFKYDIKGLSGICICITTTQRALVSCSENMQVHHITRWGILDAKRLLDVTLVHVIFLDSVIYNSFSLIVYLLALEPLMAINKKCISQPYQSLFFIS